MGVVNTLNGVLMDLPGHRGAIVARTGFQSGALELASKYGIVLYELREPRESDWQGYMTGANLTLQLFSPVVRSLQFVWDNDWNANEAQRLGYQGQKINIALDGSSSLENEDGSLNKTISRLVNDQLVRPGDSSRLLRLRLRCHPPILSWLRGAALENRNGLLVGFELDTADGYAERRAALDLVDNFLPGKRRITLGADKGYDTRDFVAACRDRNITPHVAQKTRYSAVDARTTAPSGYAVSQRIRKRVEEIFGWMKTVGGYRKTRYVGFGANQVVAMLTASAYNLVRMARLLGQPA